MSRVCFTKSLAKWKALSGFLSFKGVDWELISESMEPVISTLYF